MQTYKELSLNNVQYICLVNASVLNIERTMTTKNFIIWKNVSNYLQNLVTDFSYLAWFFKYFDCMKVMNYPPSWIIEDMPQELMHESNRNLDIPPPGHTPGNLDFDVLVRSNSLHIFVIPVQIHHVLWKIGVQIPHPMYELEATAFRNFGITKFFFPSETLFNHSEPFSFSQPRTKLISSHLNSPLSLTPFWIQHTCLKEKFKFPTP
jgi:hypothetical protein